MLMHSSFYNVVVSGGGVSVSSNTPKKNPEPKKDKQSNRVTPHSSVFSRF